MLSAASGAGRSLRPSTRNRPLPCDPNSGLKISDRLMSARYSRAGASPSMVRVRGVGIPACCSRNVVVDLSTQRSMARASFHTRTPLSRKACRRPKRKVICSSVPADMERTNTASGNAPSKPGMSMPLASAVSKAQRGSDVTTTQAPRRRMAAARRRTCQSPLSSSRKSAMRGPPAAEASAEACVDDLWSKFAAVE
jgi:hypothetical protein